jgi:hypothetical protein
MMAKRGPVETHTRRSQLKKSEAARSSERAAAPETPHYLGSRAIWRLARIISRVISPTSHSHFLLPASCMMTSPGFFWGIVISGAVALVAPNALGTPLLSSSAGAAEILVNFGFRFRFRFPWSVSVVRGGVRGEKKPQALGSRAGWCVLEEERLLIAKCCYDRARRRLERQRKTAGGFWF